MYVIFINDKFYTSSLNWEVEGTGRKQLHLPGKKETHLKRRDLRWAAGELNS